MTLYDIKGLYDILCGISEHEDLSKELCEATNELFRLVGIRILRTDHTLCLGNAYGDVFTIYDDNQITSSIIVANDSELAETILTLNRKRKIRSI